MDELGIIEGRKLHIPCEPSTDLRTSDGTAAESTFQYGGVVYMLLYTATHRHTDISVSTDMLARNVEKASMKDQIAGTKVAK